MSTFLTELFESIFTPGPTSSLLTATNAAFASLQLVLLLLLIATYSIHFLVLSLLCGGLWWAINWFVAELRIHQVEEEARKRRGEETAAAVGGDDTETEVETVVGGAERDGGSKDVEVLDRKGTLKERLAGASVSGSKSEISTEDEWEKVSENEKEK